MATINTSGKLDGTTVNSNLSITVLSRTATSVTFSYTIQTYLNSSGYTGAGYEAYTGTLVISGANITTSTTNLTLKDKSTEWSGSTVHTLSGTITVATSSYANLTASISYTVKSSADSSNSNSGSTTLATGTGAVTPTAPTSVTAKSNVSVSTSVFYIGYNADGKITIAVSGGSNVSKYRYQVSINGGAYTTLTTTTAESHTYTPSSRAAGDTLRFRVYSVSVTDTLSSSPTYSTTLTVSYRASNAPTSISVESNNSSSTSYFYIGDNCDTEFILSASGGTNVKSYQYQVSINGGDWTTCSNPYTPSGLSVGDTLKFRVCVVGLSGSNTSYLESATFVVAYKRSDAPTSVTAITDNSASSTEFFIGYNADTSISVTAEGGTNIVNYQFEASINGGEWSIITSPYTPSDLSANDTLQFRACVVGLSGENSDYTYSSTLTVKYATVSAPTDLTINTDKYLPVGTVGLSWVAPVETVTGYKVQYQINGGEWIDLDDTTATSGEYSNIDVPFRQTLAFRVAAYNASGSSAYTVSASVICAGGMLVNISGENKPGDVYVNVCGEWKRGVTYVNVGGAWKVNI